MQNVTTGSRGVADDTPVFRTRWWHGVMGLAGLGLAALLWSAVCAVPGIPWNAPRLAPAFFSKQYQTLWFDAFCRSAPKRGFDRDGKKLTPT